MTILIEYKTSEKFDIWRTVNEVSDTDFAIDELKSPWVPCEEKTLFRAYHRDTGNIVAMACVVDGVPFLMPDLSDMDLVMDSVQVAYPNSICDWQSDAKNHAYEFAADWERAWHLCNDPGWLFLLSRHMPVDEMKIAAALAMKEEMLIACKDLEVQSDDFEQQSIEAYDRFVELMKGNKTRDEAITKISEMYGLGRLYDVSGQFESAKTICEMLEITLSNQRENKEFLRLISNKIREIIDFRKIMYYAAKYHCNLKRVVGK